MRMNQHISICRTRVFSEGVANKYLQQQFFGLNMLRLNKADMLETI